MRHLCNNVICNLICKCVYVLRPKTVIDIACMRDIIGQPMFHLFSKNHSIFGVSNGYRRLYNAPGDTIAHFMTIACQGPAVDLKSLKLLLVQFIGVNMD